MKIIELIPNKGIKHIDFGMTRSLVTSIMVEKYNADLPKKINEEADSYFEGTIQFFFEDDDTFSFMEVYYDPLIVVKLYDINTWEIDGKELLSILQERDTINQEISEDGYNPIFENSKIALFDLDKQYDIIGKHTREKWAAIGIGDDRYYKAVCEIYE